METDELKEPVDTAIVKKSPPKKLKTDPSQLELF
jgi:hypothetical protein